MRPTDADVNLLRSRPHRTKLYLSIYQPSTVLACRVNDATITKGEYEITYDGVTGGSHTGVQYGMTMYVGSSAGAFDKGTIRVRSATSSVITVAENSHINWEDDDYLTVVDFFEISAVYPRIIEDPANELNTLWYKDYDIEYTDQNSVLGSFICMGGHYAGWVDDDVYYSASGSVHMKGEALSYFWTFEGADTASGTTNTPGNIAYSTPGHYTTSLLVSGTASADVSYRHISIYDKPGDGSNTPFINWSLLSLAGSRDQGGYVASIRIHEAVPNTILKDGSLVVLFAEDWYGTTKKSIGGNANSRSSIVFSGYIMDGTIQYNYRYSFVDFQVGSPTEIMKESEGFSIDITDSDDPAGQAASDPDYPSGWTLLLNLDCRRAIYHYLRWHSNVTKCCDIEFVGTDKAIYNFSSDRSSLYDAINTLMSGTLIGEVVSDRQGKIWAETDIYTEQGTYDVGSYDDGIGLSNRDWMNDPIIEEQNVPPVSWIEMGGFAYGGDPTSFGTPLLASAPGSVPGYKGSIRRQQGLALTDQNHLNDLVGQIYAYENAKYPNVEIPLAGNYRNFDIAPQEKVALTVNVNDTVRGISWTDKDFYPTAIRYTYDGATELFLPHLMTKELTTGFAGDTLEIPVVPPAEGFEIPPISIPDINIPSFEFPSGGGGGDLFAPVTFAWNLDLGSESVVQSTTGYYTFTSTQFNRCFGEIIVPDSATTVYASVLCRYTLNGTADIVGSLYCYYGTVGAADHESTGSDTSESAITITGYSAVTYSYSLVRTVALTNCTGGDHIGFRFIRDATDPNDTFGSSIYPVGFFLTVV